MFARAARADRQSFGMLTVLSNLFVARFPSPAERLSAPKNEAMWASILVSCKRLSGRGKRSLQSWTGRACVRCCQLAARASALRRSVSNFCCDRTALAVFHPLKTSWSMPHLTTVAESLTWSASICHARVPVLSFCTYTGCDSKYSALG